MERRWDRVGSFLRGEIGRQVLAGCGRFSAPGGFVLRTGCGCGSAGAGAVGSFCERGMGRMGHRGLGGFVLS